MSLWNSIKGWMDSPSKKAEQQTPAPEQPAGEAAQVVDNESVQDIFIQLCVDNGLRRRVVVKSGLLDAFCDWYSGAHNRKAVLESLDRFKNENEIAKQKIGDWV